MTSALNKFSRVLHEDKAELMAALVESRDEKESDRLRGRIIQIDDILNRYLTESQSRN